MFPDDVYEMAYQQFSKRELVNLTMALIVINGWSRLAVSFRAVPGTYVPAELVGSSAEGLIFERRSECHMSMELYKPRWRQLERWSASTL